MNETDLEFPRYADEKSLRTEVISCVALAFLVVEGCIAREERARQTVAFGCLLPSGRITHGDEARRAKMQAPQSKVRQIPGGLARPQECKRLCYGRRALPTRRFGATCGMYRLASYPWEVKRMSAPSLYHDDIDQHIAIDST